jgi:pimeloyl-ACP methyl ester carboxylesterase
VGEHTYSHGMARGNETATRRAVPALLAGLLLMMLIAGCALLPTSTTPTPDATSSAPSSAGPSTAAPSGSTTADPVVGRPVQPIPDVRPAGFISPPSGQGLQRYLGQQLRWSDCGKGLQCTSVLAPLDYADPDGEAITLAVAKRPASAKPAAGSLFINPGGPGGSGTEYVGYFTVKGLERFDVVGWDPRGTGSSTPVKCANGKAMDDYTSVDVTPDDKAEEKALTQAQIDFGRGCLERSGALLEHISTTETVRDLDLLRHLMGDEKLSYFGSSYGTKIGALYAQLYPATVGRMVLDGAVNITDKKDVSQLDGFERALGNFATWCAEQNCRLGNSKGAVERTISDLLQRVDEKPINGGRAKLTQQLALTGVLAVLYENEEAWKYLQQGLELAAFDNDGRYLMFFADQYNQRADNGTYGQLQFSFPAIRCLDSQDVSVAEAEKEGAEEAKRAATLGPFAGADLVCPLWPVAPAPKEPSIRGAGAAPIVVIGTTGDPATPYEYAERMAEQLESGHLLTLKGEGHLGYGQSSCIQRYVQSYLLDGDVPADGTRC